MRITVGICPAVHLDIQISFRGAVGLHRVQNSLTMTGGACRFIRLTRSNDTIQARSRFHSDFKPGRTFWWLGLIRR